MFKKGSEFVLHFMSRKNYQFAEKTVQSWQWHCMSLSSDFEISMRQYGRLPDNCQEKFEIRLKHELNKVKDKYSVQLKELDDVIKK